MKATKEYFDGYENGKNGCTDFAKAELFRSGGLKESGDLPRRDYWTGAYHGFRDFHMDKYSCGCLENKGAERIFTADYQHVCAKCHSMRKAH